MKRTFVVIMAGGVGSRFWPRSRKGFPKQYLKLGSDSSMIQETAERFRQIIEPERIFVVTTRAQKSVLLDQLPWLLPENVLYEPFGKNTAPAIGLAAIHIDKREPNAKMIVAPADHRIHNTDEYLKVFRHGIALLDQYPDALITIGITPTYPATGYGYIQKGETIESNDVSVSKVKTFAEKPSLEIAEKFFSSGEFYWNSGTFLWRVKTILHNMDELMPELFDGLQKIKKHIGSAKEEDTTTKVYKQIYSESIDYGIMEHASNVLMMEGNFGWNDLGSWEEVYKISPKDEQGNVLLGDVVAKDIKNSYVETESRTVALIGVDDLIVVDTPDALLICKKEKSQDVKWVTEKLKQSGNEKVL